MNILAVSHSNVVRSYQGKLRLLAQEAGVSVSLLLPPRWKEGGLVVDARPERCGNFETHVIPAFKLGRIASYFYSPLIFHKIITDVPPSVIYLEEEPWSVAAWQAVHAARAIGAQVVFFTWENIRRRYKLPSEMILKYVMASSTAAVAGNSEAALILRERGFDKPVLVLPQHGVDVEECQKNHSAPLPFASLVKPVIVYMGRLESEKGIHLLLRALSGLQGEWNLLVVGNGPAKEELNNLCKAFEINRRVKFVDAVPHDEVSQFLRSSDILVLPSVTTSLWKEQFGRVLVEAMACGLPVVGSTSGAIPEVIGDAGLLFKEGDADDLAEKIAILVRNRSLRLEYGLRGRRRVENNFTNIVLARKLYDFLLRVRQD